MGVRYSNLRRRPICCSRRYVCCLRLARPDLYKEVPAPPIADLAERKVELLDGRIVRDGPVARRTRLPLDVGRPD